MVEDPLETRITLRLPVVLRDDLTESAAKHSRSMNGEIVHRLEEFGRALLKIVDLSEAVMRLDDDLRKERDTNRKLVEDMTRVANILHDTQDAKAELDDKYRIQNFDLREAQNELLSAKRKAEQSDQTASALRHTNRLMRAFEMFLTGAADGNDALLRKAVAAFKSPPTVEELREELAIREREATGTEEAPPAKSKRKLDFNE